MIKRLNFIVNNSGDFDLKFITVILILKSFFETLGIGIIYPFFDLIINQKKIDDFFIYTFLVKNGLLKSHEGFLILTGISLIVFYVLGATFSVYAKFKSANFIWDINTSIIRLSFKKNIFEKLEVFKKSNSNKRTHDIINEVHVFINGFLFNFIDLLPRLFLLIFLVGYLTFLNPLLTFISFSFLIVFYSLVLVFLKKKINMMSSLRYNHQNSLFDYVQSSLRALKDIKINAYESYFVEKIRKPAFAYSTVNKNINIYSSLPKFFIEALVLISIVLYAIFSFNKNSLIEQIPILSTLSLALIKLLPIIQGMFTNITRMRFNFKSVAVIENNIKDAIIPETSTAQNIKPPKKIETIQIENLSFSYGNKLIFKGLNFTISEGDFCIIYGESGSGKTTLTEIILGFLKQDAGNILINGKTINNNILLSKDFNVGYVSQDIILIEGNLIENITLKSNEVTDELISQIYNLVSFCSLEDVVSSIGGLNGFISEGGKNLSTGQKQRIILARSLFKNPDILFLDEATSALNSKLEHILMERLLKKGITIIMISHNEELKKYSNNIISLK